jgi:hypothetical protein
MKKLALATSLFLSLNANAALYDRGNGMIYDSTLNITLLQDANYAKTSGYAAAYNDPRGIMTWSQATTWAANLVYGGYSDWRLASARLIGNDSTSFNGSTDVSYNNTRSELGYLFFELGNKSLYSTAGVEGTDYGLRNTTFIDAGTNQSVSFLNVENFDYWEAELYKRNSSKSWNFSTYWGLNGYYDNSNKFYAWAVRDGDVAAVPIPSAAWLFGSCLIGLAGVVRRKV